ncbi:hypothetical protein F4818DRAFT_452139 [Hypoxylon cercidicola]|nr:hypothetical protein F4818DRAFT_452139 [Hypoxylon cercidicola]
MFPPTSKTVLLTFFFSLLLFAIGSLFVADPSPLGTFALLLSVTTYLFKVRQTLGVVFLAFVFFAGAVVLGIASEANLSVCAFLDGQEYYQIRRYGKVLCQPSFRSLLAKEFEHLDWDLDLGPFNDLSLLWFDRLVTTARVVASKLNDKLSGKYVPTPLTGLEALEFRCRGEQRAKLNRFALHDMRTGERLPGFVGGDGSYYYDNLRAIERAEQDAREEAYQRRLAEHKRLSAKREWDRLQRKIAFSSRVPVAWPLREYRTEPSSHQSLVVPGPSSVLPLEPRASAAEPTAKAAPVDPPVTPPMSAALEQGPEQDTSLVRVPEQAAELPREPQPAPVYQVAALSRAPELAAVVKHPQPIYRGPPATQAFAPEVEMLDVDDMDEEEETLPEQPAEPRSSQVFEESMQVDNTNEEQAQELPAPMELEQEQTGWQDQQDQAEPEPESESKVGQLDEDEFDTIMGNSPSYKRKKEPQSNDSPSQLGGFAPASSGFGQTVPEPSFSERNDTELDVQMGNSPSYERKKESQNYASPQQLGGFVQASPGFGQSGPESSFSELHDSELDILMGNSPSNERKQESQNQASPQQLGGSTQASPGPGLNNQVRPSQGELRAADGTPLLDRNGNPIVGHAMVINVAPSRPPPPAAPPVRARPPPPPGIPDRENDPVLDEEDHFDMQVAFYMSEGETEESARFLAAREMGW